MTKKYIVVDLNVLRKTSLEELVLREPRTQFVLPDVAFIELTKSEQWESTLFNSLRTLASVPHRVHAAWSVNNALQKELRSLQSVSGHMLHHEATLHLRALLSWVATGNKTAKISAILSNTESSRRALASDHLNHTHNKSTVRELVDATKRFIPSDLQKEMRSQKVARSERLDIVFDIATGLLPQILSERNVSRGRAIAFMKTRPVVLRYLLTYVWYCTHWITLGGLESFLDSNVTNDTLDQQYVITASSFDDLLTEDNRAKDSFDDLTELLSRKIH